MSTARGDSPGSLGLDLYIAFLACMSVAYHVVLLTRMPASSFYVVFGFAVVIAVCVVVVGIRRPGPATRHALAPRAVLVSICLGLALFSVYVQRPDADDFSFLHRALYQLDHLDEPFAFVHTAHDVLDLPPISVLHLTSAIEPATALLAHALGLPPLAVLQYLNAALALLVLPAVYFQLLRLHGLGAGFAVLGVLGAIAFLFTESDSHRAFGNFTLVRAWQGKCILVAVFLPLVYLYVVRFAMHGHARDLLRLHAATIGATGLSSSALFLVPWMVVLLSASIVSVQAFSESHVKRILTASIALLYPALLIGTVFSGMLPMPDDTTVWTSGWPQAPLDSFVLVFTSWPRIVLAIAAGTMASILARHARLGAVLACFAVAACLLPLLPVTSSVLKLVVPEAVYWRLAYVLPVPLAVGLVIGGGLQRWRIDRKWTGGLIAGALALALATVGDRTIVGWQHLGTPLLQRQPRDALELSDDVLRKSDPRVVLAPESVVVVLGLLRPTIRFVSTRDAETRHVFLNANRGEEGERRVLAARWLSSCQRERARIESIEFVLSLGVDTVIAKDCGVRANRSLGRILDPTLTLGPGHLGGMRTAGYVWFSLGST